MTRSNEELFEFVKTFAGSTILLLENVANDKKSHSHLLKIVGQRITNLTNDERTEIARAVSLAETATEIYEAHVANMKKEFEEFFGE